VAGKNVVDQAGNRTDTVPPDTRDRDSANPTTRQLRDTD
jgi:hypothetical protein